MIDKQRLNPGRKFEQVRVGAREIFLRDGYSGASVDDIARAAGVSKATLYSYFPEKQMMYREVLLDEIDRLGQHSPIAIDNDTPPDDALPQMTRQIAGWLVSGPVLSLLRTNIAEAARFPDVSQRYHTALTALLRDVVRAHMDRWVGQGALMIDDTTLAAEQLIRLAGTGLQERALLTEGDGLPDSTIDEISDSAARMFMAAHRGRSSGIALAAAS